MTTADYLKRRYGHTMTREQAAREMLIEAKEIAKHFGDQGETLRTVNVAAMVEYLNGIG